LNYNEHTTTFSSLFADARTKCGLFCRTVPSTVCYAVFFGRIKWWWWWWWWWWRSVYMDNAS